MDSTGHCYSPDCGLLEHESVVDLYFCEYLLACIDFVGLAEFGCHTAQESFKSEAARRSKDFDIFTL